MFKKTLKNTIEFSGVGLHTGCDVNVRVLPSEDTGIVFLRKDIVDSPFIKADSKNVVATSYATTIGYKGVTVSTVEHLLSAFYAMGVDDAVVELDGPEIPVMDGSSASFVDMIEDAGLRELKTPRKYLFIKEPVRVKDGDKYIYLIPSRKETFNIYYSVDFSHPYLDRQAFSVVLSPEVYKKELMSARTFGFLRDVEMLKQNGLAKGGSLSNAVVIGEKSILNKEGLRFKDEFVRHKILDLIGDISLSGYRIIGSIEAHRAGHALNLMLVRKLLANPSFSSVAEFEEELPRASCLFEEELATA